MGFNILEMDMRQYDPAIARWTSIDPVIHYGYSTYSAFDNNPIFWADPSGADSFTFNWDTNQYEQYNDDGKLINDNANFDDAVKWAEGQNDGNDDESAYTSSESNESLGLIGGGLAGYETATAAEAVVATEAAVSTSAGVSGLTMTGVAAVPLLFTGDSSKYPEGRDPKDRIHVTYTKTGPNGMVYVGRASGFGTPQQVVARRDASHHMTALGFGPAVIDKFAKGVAGRSSIRGREQQYIDYNGGALSDPNRRLVGGKSANAIRGVSKNNLSGYMYHNVASMAFGELFGFTGNIKWW